ncbi:MAG: bifunctional 2-polyprenyl-6-hydroxyphenol methylase/3-demethylubiquinol 3-O-methyltransferase UbiG [Rickettsia endosymbiont of Labidopullus appendiculatus]|nr:bifunctional 2-polyprenyl-6-hydroxyphenol methylase/3-demethylubiquinol 3-O-methyltransferase UbiG [Rickettsia endosymbiont of Labidopullus appendiculatus]
MSTKSSINQIELEKFSRISSQWWQKDGEFKILHQINPIRIGYIIEKIKEHFNVQDDILPCSNLEILDVGCGGGLITSPLCKLNGIVTGIDALQSNIDIAVQHASEQNLNIQYLKSTVEELVSLNRLPTKVAYAEGFEGDSERKTAAYSSVREDLSTESTYKSPAEVEFCRKSNKKQYKYDVVLCLEVIEHIDNPGDFIKNLASLVKPNGMIIISTINRTVKSYMLAILMAEYLLNWVPKNTHDHSKFLKPSEIYSMFNDNNIGLKELKGLTYNIVNGRWQLSDDIDVNYFAYLTK